MSPDHKAASEPQKWLKIIKKYQNLLKSALSALMWGPTAVMSTISRAILIEWT